MIDVKIIKKAKSAVTGNAGGGYGGAPGGVSVPGLSSSVATLTNIIESMQNVLIPVDVNGARVEWSSPYLFAVKSVKGFYSDEFLSAHGLNAEGGGGGGAGYERLDAWTDYSADASGWVLSALLGHDLHTRLTAIEGDYVKLSELPSLSGYATEQWVLGKGYITQDALTPYLTKTDADGKFVTALGVSGKFLTWTKDGVVNNITVPFATDADTLDGYHESSFLRRRGSTRVDQDNTLWDQIGIKDYYDALPDGLTDTYTYGEVITLSGENVRFEMYANHRSADANGLYFRTGWNDSKLPWRIILDDRNYASILDPRYSHTLTLQLNGTEVGTFNPTANKTINIGDVASAAALASHVGNATVHISATERAMWNKAATDLSTIIGSDSDTVINKWEEVVAFLDTYTEADTLAGLLSNKVDKVAGYGLSKNDFNDTLLAKLNSIESGANRYVLPTASATVKGGIKVGSGLMMASEVLSVNLNASHIPSLDWSKITTGKPTTLAGYGITDAYTKAESRELFAPVVAYNYADGCLVRLKTPANVATMVTVLIEGNSYWNKMPIKTIVQFYNYPPSDEIINTGAIHYGQDFGTIKAFNYDGHIYLWFIENLDYYTFAVTAITEAAGKSIGNAVESITDKPMPTAGVTRLVTITPSKGLRSDNYASILDGRYQQAANIHALTFAAGAFAAKTYDPKSGAVTVHIPTTTDHIAEGGKLYFTNARAISALSPTTNALQSAISTKLDTATFNAFKTAFDGMFELVNIGTDAAPLYAIHAKYGFYADDFLSAHGLNSAGGNGGSSYDRLDAWSAYTTDKAGYVLSAALGYDLYQNKADSVALSALASRVGTLEGKNYLDALTLNQSGSGNAVTAVALSADKKTLTVTKGATFLTQHQSLESCIRNYTYPAGTTYDLNNCAKNSVVHEYRWSNGPKNGIASVLDLTYSPDWRTQLFAMHSADTEIHVRSRYDGTTWGAWKKLLDSENTKISGGVITINGASITPLTQHQSLSNYYTKGEVDAALNGYVTLNTAQTISGAKTFSNILVVQDGIRILYANERGCLQLGNTDHRQGEISAWNGVTLGKLRLNASIVDVNGYVTANLFVRNGGSASQFLKADGSVDSNSYALSSSLANYYTKTESDGRYLGYFGWKSSPGYDISVKGNYIGYCYGQDTPNGGGPIVSFDAGRYGFQLLTSGTNATPNMYFRSHGYSGDEHGSWQMFLTNNNYASILDSRYYTESEINSKLGGYLPRSGGSMTNTNVVTNLNADLLDGVHKDAFNGAARYVTADMRTGGYYKIKIKANNGWMLGFKILAYQSYFFDEINISGCNYGNSYWFKPTASLLCSSKSQIAVTFGYDSVWNLWVAIPAMHYAGISVTDVANGFQQVSDVHNLFEIVYEETLTGTVQTVVTPSRHATIADSVASASQLQTARLINGTAFNGTADITTAKWGMARNITIGNTAKSVDGSGDVAWSLADIGALPLVGGTMANSNLVSNLNADLLDGHHENEFLRYRGYLSTEAERGSSWAQIGLRTTAGMLPDGLSGKYNFGVLASFATFDGRFEIYASEHASRAPYYEGISYRAGWMDTKGDWLTILDTANYSSLITNVASATKLADNATYTAWGCPFFANGKPQNVSGDMTGVGSIASYDGIALYIDDVNTAVGSRAYWYGLGLNLGRNDNFVTLGGYLGLKLFTAAGMFTMLQNGNIGFGTVNPAYKVDIVGTAKISEGLLIGGLLSANGGISTTAITATEIHLGGLTLKYDASNKGLQVIGGGIYTDSYLSAHGLSPTAVDYEARIAALETKIAQLESQLNA